MLNNKLDNAYTIAKEGNYLLAIETCDRLLSEYPKKKNIVLRKRSHINAYNNNVDAALSDRLEIIDNGSNEPQDYFFSGVYSLETRKYPEAIELFNSAITLSDSANNNYYLEESFLLRAYAYLGIENYKKVLDDCKNVSEDIEYYIEGDGSISKKRLVSYISNMK